MLNLIVVPLAATGTSAIVLPVVIMGSLGLIFGLISLCFQGLSCYR